MLFHRLMSKNQRQIYICGWVLFACKSENLRRSVTFSVNNLMYLVEICRLNKKNLCLVTYQNIVRRLIQSNPFFGVNCIEFVFSKILTTKAILNYVDGFVCKIIDCINKISTIVFHFIFLFTSRIERRGKQSC